MGNLSGKAVNKLCESHDKTIVELREQLKVQETEYSQHIYELEKSNASMFEQIRTLKSNIHHFTEENPNIVDEYLVSKNIYFIPDYIERKLIVDFLTYYNDHLKHVIDRWV